MQREEKSVLYQTLEKIEGGMRAIEQYDVLIEQSIEEDQRIVERYVGKDVIHRRRPGIAGEVVRIIEEVVNLLDPDKTRHEVVKDIVYGAHALAKKASQQREENREGIDTLLLVVSSVEEKPRKGATGPVEISQLIASARYLRCLKRDEARRVYAAITAPEQEETDQWLVQVTLGKRVSQGLNKIALMQVITSERIQAEVEQIENLSLTAELPGFV